MAGATSGGGSSSPLRDANVRMGKEKVADGTGRFEASAWLRAALRRRGSLAVTTRGDARRWADAGMGGHSGYPVANSELI